MPGIGTNILAARLKELEAGGIVRKRKLPPPAASTVYELTEYGQELEEPLYALARWGARSLPPPAEGRGFYPDWGLNAFAALLDPKRPPAASRRRTSSASPMTPTRCGSSTARCTSSPGPREEADLDVATDQETFFGLASGELDPRAALARGAVKIETGKPADTRAVLLGLQLRASRAESPSSRAARDGALVLRQACRSTTSTAIAAF